MSFFFLHNTLTQVLWEIIFLLNFECIIPLCSIFYGCCWEFWRHFDFWSFILDFVSPRKLVEFNFCLRYSEISLRCALVWVCFYSGWAVDKSFPGTSVLQFWGFAFLRFKIDFLSCFAHYSSYLDVVILGLVSCLTFAPFKEDGPKFLFQYFIDCYICAIMVLISKSIFFGLLFSFLN